jgi:23S rRNA (adenine1618-N6)-methyltransferase
MAAKSSPVPPAIKPGLHPRNRFRERYDFPALIVASPELKEFVKPNAYSDASIDYANPAAVRALNQALLRHGYGLAHWDLPAGYLCPPIPGRSDYVHYVADLLSGGRATAIPRGPQVRVLDIGVGANCAYPLIGASEYGWSFVGTEIDATALQWARGLAAGNPAVSGLIELRHQASPMQCFKDVTLAGETFTVAMCNPPFHPSAEAAAAGSLRKQRNLTGRADVKNRLNFGGTSRELWCPGGELAFVERMISQSAAVPRLCQWFTSLIAKGEHLPRLQRALESVGPSKIQVLPMAQGQKQSRILAWSFLQP